jgi:hypothetical protein
MFPNKRFAIDALPVKIVVPHQALLSHVVSCRSTQMHRCQICGEQPAQAYGDVQSLSLISPHAVTQVGDWFCVIPSPMPATHPE